MIYPYLSYCIIIWGVACPTHLNKLIILQKRIVRIISNVYYLAHTNVLFNQLRILKIDDICNLRTVEFICKHKFGVLPACCNIYLNAATTAHLHFTRHECQYFVPRYRTTIREKCITIRGPKYWNALPSCLTSLSTLAQIKRALITNYLLKYSD